MRGSNCMPWGAGFNPREALASPARSPTLAPNLLTDGQFE